MAKTNTLKGVLLVGLGATSYGMLATFVKKSYQEGYTTAEVTTSQFVYGLLGLLIITLLTRRRDAGETPSSKAIGQLMLAGTSTGLTSLFYYNAVKFIPVSIGIVLLMQTVWMGVALEAVLERKFPSPSKIISVLIVLIGTALATNLVNSDVIPDWRGIAWGLLAAASFTTTMFTANRVALGVSSAKRSLFMLMGGALVVFFFAFFTQDHAFNLHIFAKWGIILALFGTIIPPILLNKGFPLTGIGLGSIVASLELPVSVLMAFFILNETVLPLQWTGIVLIILAIVLMNVKLRKSS